jgi:hypothetical protein
VARLGRESFFHFFTDTFFQFIPFSPGAFLGYTAEMKFDAFLSFGVFLLSSDFVLAQTSSATVSAASPSSTFDAATALLAYGVNVSDYTSDGSATAKFRRGSTYNGCSFSVNKNPRELSLSVLG